MPNWCNNRLNISLRDMCKHDREKFRKETGIGVGDDAEFDFQKILPCPQELLDHSSGSFCSEAEYAQQEPCKILNSLSMTKEMSVAFKEKHGAKDWYEWTCDHWGTKWSASEVYFEENTEESIEIHFETPWGPAGGIYQHLKDTYEDIYISWFYDEPGMEFAGYLPD